MSPLEASIQLRLTLAHVIEVRERLARDRLPGRDVRWTLARVEAALSDAIDRLDPPEVAP